MEEKSLNETLRIFKDRKKPYGNQPRRGNRTYISFMKVKNNDFKSNSKRIRNLLKVYFMTVLI